MADGGTLALPRAAGALAVAAVTLATAALPVLPAEAATTALAATVSVAPAAAGVLGTGPLTVRIGVENDGSGVLPAGEVRLALEQATVADAATLADRLGDPTPYGQLQGYGVGAAAVPAIDPGERTIVTITVPAAVVEAYTQQAGAHLVAAQLRVGEAAVAAGASTVTRAPTGTERVRFADVVPLTLPVDRAPTGLAVADVVDAQSSPGGAWWTALQAARADPAATLALDPAVLASIRILGAAAPQSGIDLLAALAALPNTTVELPYADGDVSLERAAGAARVLAPTGFTGVVQIASAAATPAPTATPSPSTTPATTSAAALTRWTWSPTRVGWPVSGSVAAADLPFLTRSGDSTVLLSSSDVRDTAARRVAGPLAIVAGTRALVADASVSGLLTAAAGRGPAAESALAALIGLLAVDATAGGSPSVLAVPGRITPPRLAEVLGTLRGQRWIEPADLAALTSATRIASVALAGHALDAGAVTRATALVDADRSLAHLGAAVPGGAGSTLTGPYRLAVLSVLGARWRDARTTWAGEAAATTTAVRGLVDGAVTLLPLSPVHNLGVNSSLPFYVRNSLPVPVRVQLTGAPSNGRMIVDGSVTRTIGALQSAALISLPTRSISDGDVQIVVTLSTPDGTELGASETADVTVNAGWDTLGAGIFMAALLALFGVGVYRNLTRRRRRARPATA